jgi:hypothetical protein
MSDENLIRNASSPHVCLISIHAYFSIASWIVMWITDSVFSHTGMIFPDGKIHQMTTKGYFVQPLLDIADNRSYFAIAPMPWLPISDAQSRSDAIQKNTPQYNWLGIVKLGLLELFSLNGKFRPKHLFDFCLTTAVVTFLLL